MEHMKYNLKRYKIVVAIILIVVVAFGVMSLVKKQTRHDGYQAVFLTNNQVYFGKIQNQSRQFVSLSDIYYIQVTQELQSQAAGERQSPANINLVKLGSELHGPQDTMEINRDHILFIEDLKSDSQVVGAIENYKNANQ